MNRRDGVAAAAMAAALAAGPGAGAVTMEGFVGDWAGTSRKGTSYELRIESIGEKRRVRGARCDMRKSWIDTVMPLEAMNAFAVEIDGRRTIIMKPTEAQVRLGVLGNAGRATAEWVGGERLLYTITPSEKARRKGTREAKFHMRRTERLECLGRYSAEPIARRAPDAGAKPAIMGDWSYTSASGKIAEATFESVDEAGVVGGRFCIRMIKTGDIQIVDLEPGAAPRYRAHYDPGERAVTFERNRIERSGKRRRDRWVMTLADDGTLGVAVTNRAESAQARTWTVTMARGAHPQGCLVHTRARGAGEGQAAETE